MRHGGLIRCAIYPRRSHRQVAKAFGRRRDNNLWNDFCRQNPLVLNHTQHLLFLGARTRVRFPFIVLRQQGFMNEVEYR